MRWARAPTEREQTYVEAQPIAGSGWRPRPVHASGLYDCRARKEAGTGRAAAPGILAMPIPPEADPPGREPAARRIRHC
jgi:hypothetical protein